MTSVSDRLRPVPAILSTEGQVLAATESIVQKPGSDAQEIARILAQSGLLAISIPSVFDGADISNVVVAEAISRLSIWNRRAAELFAHHLTALELLRTSGTTEQRRAVYRRVIVGEIFNFSADPSSHPRPHLGQSGLSFVVEPGPSIAALRGADWHVLIASALGMGDVAAILAWEDRQSPDGCALPVEAAVSPDNVLELGPDALQLAALMQAFLQGAICRGTGDAALLPDSPGNAPTSTVELELLDAIVLKVASIIDGIQVELPNLDLGRIDRLCHALQMACQRCSSQITPPR